MEVENIIDDFLNSHVHIYLDDGVYVNKNYNLVFNKEEHDKLFKHGYYRPDYKDWLLKNSKLRIE
jgi:hypothetical protein